MSWQDIPGFSSFLPIYQEAVNHFGDGAVFVEVGVALGHSVAALARMVIDAGHKNTRIFAVDPWAGHERNGEQQDMLRGRADGDFGLFCKYMLENAPEELERIRVLRIPSIYAARAISFAHMVLIDGDHTESAVTEDINAWSPVVRAQGEYEHGWLCGDDYHPPYHGVIRAVQRAFPAERIETCGEHGWTWRVLL